MGATTESTTPPVRAHPQIRPWLGGLYSPPRTPVIVDVPPVTYLARTGEGPPEGNLRWAEAIDELRTSWRALHDAEAAAAATTPSPAPLLEVLWQDLEQARWTVLLALDEESVRRHSTAAGTPAVRHLHEGWCAQLLYYGAPGAAGTTNRSAALSRLDRFVTRQGYRMRSDGVLHEIYLDDVAAPAARMIARRRVQPGG